MLIRTAVGAVALGIAVAAQAQTTTTIARVPGYLGLVTMDTIGKAVEIPDSYGRTYTAVKAVFESLKIPMEIRDSVGGVVGTLKYMRERTFAGGQLSRYIDCGDGVTGPNADAFRIHLAIVARMVPLPNERTNLTIALAAGGTNVSGNAWDPVRCPTRGILEYQMMQKVRTLLGVPERKPG
ncbi:MAG: hypothetical protein ABI877_18655 [Gemmatimonadaceae bacterium]